MREQGKFMTSAFYDDAMAADLMYFDKGIHIVCGTVGSLSDDVFSGKIDVPFVLRSNVGDLAVGGLKVKTNNLTKKYIVSAVLSQIQKNHDNGKNSTLNPVFTDPDGRNFLVLTAVKTEDCGGLKPLKNAESFVVDWVSGYPGIYL